MVAFAIMVANRCHSIAKASHSLLTAGSEALRARSSLARAFKRAKLSIIELCRGITVVSLIYVNLREIRTPRDQRIRTKPSEMTVERAGHVHRATVNCLTES